ncbi:thermonuclease family protein [Pararhodobacter sp. SW119]|uniref:thermonuclease family protein n=1 Tax=Pararhodobacter sp. SW119 TaxID=2780075 RepID=UPI001AE07A5B|nr:thermonuclease family protein [Pararhodobacter sp. SW119]
MKRLKGPIAAAALAATMMASAPVFGLDAGYQVAATMTGVAVAHDGDDIRFGSVQIRLRGIAAPEDYRGNREPGGPEAAQNLAGLVNDREVTCHLDGTTAGRSRRPVAICMLDGKDIGEMQVRAGHARDCPAFSGGRYAAAEHEARAAGDDLSRIYALPGYCRR